MCFETFQYTLEEHVASLPFNLIIKFGLYPQMQAIVPDFLCHEALDAGKIKVVWQGDHPWENTLYFGTRKNTMYYKELAQLKKLFEEKWERGIVR